MYARGLDQQNPTEKLFPPRGDAASNIIYLPKYYTYTRLVYVR